MVEFFSLLSKYYLQGAQQEFKDPTIEREEKQTVFDEEQVNESFEPANDAFSGLREAGDWIINWFSEVFGQLFGNIM